MLDPSTRSHGMLTRPGHALVLTALALLTMGLASANPLLLGLAAIPLTALVLALTETVPRVHQARLEAPARARAGDTVEITARVHTQGPTGLLAVHLELPEAFDLVDGDNRALVEARPDEPVEISLKARVTRRGRFTVGPLAAAPVHASGLRSSPMTVHADGTRLEVNPGVIPLRRLRSLRGTASTLAPEGDKARAGLKTTDFRELREYRYGDPPRSVNWKATARLGPATETPLVNEYEVEGRKAVWFMLDAGRHMAVGTTVENGFEMGVTATSGLALSYIDRGYKVGFYAYNADHEDLLFPDVGASQYEKLQRRLAKLSPGDAQEGPLRAVMACRPWLLEVAPMVVFVTRTEIDTRQLEKALRKIRSLDPDNKRPLVVLEPQPYPLVPGGPAEEHTSRLLEHLAQPRHERLRELGATVIGWNPQRAPLERLLFERVNRHA